MLQSTVALVGILGSGICSLIVLRLYLTGHE